MHGGRCASACQAARRDDSRALRRRLRAGVPGRGGGLGSSLGGPDLETAVRPRRHRFSLVKAPRLVQIVDSGLSGLWLGEHRRLTICTGIVNLAFVPPRLGTSLDELAELTS